MTNHPGLESFQARFHRRWMHLNDPHVRALAWLLCAPDLLDPAAPQWQGRIATLGPVDHASDEWLNRLDAAPDELHAFLDVQPLTRLGRYAEKLMAFYFRHQGTLVAHGLQVRADKGETIGEFDFLLRQGAELVHWEFASKFYLLESSGDTEQADHFIGPGLADTLGTKMRKIMERQLSLSQHPAARAQLPQPVARAQALVKGWLFYYGCTPRAARLPGVAHAHCHGFWSPLGELDRVGAERFTILTRLKWLAPAKAPERQCLDRAALKASLTEHFAADDAPVMIAIMEPGPGCLLEVDRGFIVPDDWRGRAGERIGRMIAN